MDKMPPRLLPGGSHLSDRDISTDLQRTLDQADVEWMRRNASPGLARDLPRSAALYMFVWQPFFSVTLAGRERENFPMVLYVGKTTALRTRYNEYASILSATRADKDERQKLLRDLFKARQLEFWYAPVRPAELGELEQRLITIFDPPGNTQRPRVQVVKSVPAF